jgi:ABC-type transport system substrate-binding protein
LLAVISGHASSRPHYGGTVRVLLQYRVNSVDPVAEEDHPATRDRMARLTFETLTQVDGQGRVRPRLATSWRADPAKRIWQFRLRLANFHDGSSVTAADVVASLKTAEPGWRYTAADRQTVTIETPAPVLHLPEMLALEKFAVVKRRPDGMLLGTGPYRLSQWQTGEHAVFTADEDYWGGRSYPDAIEFQMGASLREQLLQRQLGPNSAAELYPDGVRSLEQSGQEVLLSRPADLLVIVFLLPDNAVASGRRKPVDPRLRQALAGALDRTAISNAMLQKRAAPASGLLPQWLTGYEFLMNGAFDRERAHKLVTEASPGAMPAPISLAYDVSDPVAKLVAERIALDSSQAGLTVRPYGESHVNSKLAQASTNADALLLRLPLASLDPSVALASRAADLGLDADTVSASLGAARPEDLLQTERKMLENSRIIPVAHVSQALWLNGSAHNWLLLPNGLWDLDQLWVEGGR